MFSTASKIFVKVEDGVHCSCSSHLIILTSPYSRARALFSESVPPFPPGTLILLPALNHLSLEISFKILHRSLFAIYPQNLAVSSSQVRDELTWNTDSLRLPYPQHFVMGNRTRSVPVFLSTRFRFAKCLTIQILPPTCEHFFSPFTFSTQYILSM